MTILDKAKIGTSVQVNLELSKDRLNKEIIEAIEVSNPDVWSDNPIFILGKLFCSNLILPRFDKSNFVGYKLTQCINISGTFLFWNSFTDFFKDLISCMPVLMIVGLLKLAINFTKGMLPHSPEPILNTFVSFSCNHIAASWQKLEAI